MRFVRQNRVFLVLVALGVLVVTLVAYRIKKQQAAAVPRRQIEVVVGVVKPLRKDLDVKLAYTADVLPNKQVAVFAARDKDELLAILGRMRVDIVEKKP